MTKKAIVVGATSGIGRELVKTLAQEGYAVGITGRRTELLNSLAQELNRYTVEVQEMDITHFDQARGQLADLINRMGGLDLLIINSGVGDLTLNWDKELNIINTNATGFVALANAAFHYFSAQNSGHIVGISSLAAERGNGQSPSYSATKAFMSTYLQGLRYRASRKKSNIYITDIRPGFVDTPMTQKNNFPMPWMATPEKAARQIGAAIRRKAKVAYITRRWYLISWLMSILPDAIYTKIT